MEKTIIIGGGVGPAAGLILHRLIIENTMADRDQEYLKTIHMSASDMVPDRSESIKAGCPELPAQGMAAVVKAAFSACRDMGQPAVAGIACNTFHAPSIWKAFRIALEEYGILSPEERGVNDLVLVNMIDETVEFIRENYPAGASIGILSTEGTCMEKIYTDPLKKAGFHVLEPEGQQRTHEIIYNRKWGIKSRPEITAEARDALNSEAEKLRDSGAELIILACTELPLVLTEHKAFGIPLLNPMEVLARTLVKTAAPSKLQKVTL